MSAFIAVFGGFGFMIFEGALLFVLLFIPLPFPVLVAFLTIINGLLAFVIYLPMHKKASLRLQRMEA
jgi:Flp pilus assembly protein TadB